MNINFIDLEKLIKIAESADIQSLEVTDGDARISIICQANGNTPHSKTAHSESRTVTSHNNTSNNTSADNSSMDETVTTEVANSSASSSSSQVLAPMLGTFYLRSEPTAEAFFKVGDQVVAGQTLCIIEAMKMMHEVKAEADGTIQEILIDEGDVVEYAQPLFIIAPDS
ncbi:acetyl-CoA carboxylase biotin carboxyl carrier protein [Psychrobacter sp. N25K4-3-2]|uniref:acetyl-CoA carboxylase biotin carboxyl carrier protein n=1 Tax=Psychrobacter sp. N25K4-3-2 TaxID=2785026 RepID=UPI00188B7AFB|nr:acetyl-CoA carboxylase biotin carboxyl carrier protein [Psychrobacter sp. N25K4-3-2]MBF4490739.1 acetyl-CoA carboxylase biotin carboxyl carrier protein [Psychrobacter sp. N25K4-3-2]